MGHGSEITRYLVVLQVEGQIETFEVDIPDPDEELRELDPLPRKSS